MFERHHYPLRSDPEFKVDRAWWGILKVVMLALISFVAGAGITWLLFC